MHEELLEAVHDALAADADPSEALAVYGDWLQTRGDRHGDLIALGLALASPDAGSDERYALGVQHRALLDELAPRLLGDPGDGEPWWRRLGDPDLDSLAPPGLDGFHAHTGHRVVEHCDVEIEFDAGFAAALDLVQVAGEPDPFREALLAHLLAQPCCELLGAARIPNDSAYYNKRVFPLLGACRHLRQLTLSAPGFDSLPPLPALRALDFRSRIELPPQTLPAAGFARLSGFPALRTQRVGLPARGVESALAALAALPPLAELELVVDEDSLAAVERAPVAALERAVLHHDALSLVLDGGEFTTWLADTLPELHNLRGLQLLRTEHADRLAGALTAAGPLRSLAVLDVRDYGDTMFAWLPALPHLAALHLRPRGHVLAGAEALVAAVERQPHLEALGVEGVTLTGDEFRRLVGHRPLRRLVCSSVSRDGLVALQESATAESLAALGLDCEPELDVADLAFLRDLPALADLWFDDPPLGTRFFELLAACPRLRSLALSGCRYHASWNGPLRGMSELRELRPGWMSRDDKRRLDEIAPRFRVVARDCSSAGFLDGPPSSGARPGSAREIFGSAGHPTLVSG